jgi:hypothetical protein
MQLHQPKAEGYHTRPVQGRVGEEIGHWHVIGGAEKSGAANVT